MSQIFTYDCTLDFVHSLYKFTGKERDTESGNDYFGARYYASSVGRFMSPDWSEKAQPVPYAKMDDPQSLNLYAYVGNNPLSRTDPTGHWCIFGILGTTCTPAPLPPPPPPAPPTNVAGAVPPAPAPKPAPNSSLAPHGLGVQLGVEAAVGLEAGGHGAGAAATGSVGAGVFAGGDQGVNGGVFGTYGVALPGGVNGGDPAQTNSATVPAQPLVVGAGANGGASAFITNGTSRSDMNGLFSTTSAAVSFGLIGVAAQFSFGQNDAGNTIWVLSGGLAPGAAVYEYSIITNTVPIYP